MNDYQQAYDEARKQLAERVEKKRRLWGFLENRKRLSIECKVFEDHDLCWWNIRFHHFDCICHCHKGEL